MATIAIARGDPGVGCIVILGTVKNCLAYAYTADLGTIMAVDTIPAVITVIAITVATIITIAIMATAIGELE